MKSSRVFIVVFLPITLIILVVGEASAASQGFSSDILAQGVIIYGLYGALIGAILGGIAAGIHRSVAGKKKTPPTQPTV